MVSWEFFYRLARTVERSSPLGMGRGIKGGGLRAVQVLDLQSVEDYDVHAAIAGTALGGFIGIDGESVGAADDGKARPAQLKRAAEGFQHRNGAGAGKLPIALESFVMDRHSVGMPFQLDRIGKRRDELGEFLHGGQVRLI